MGLLKFIFIATILCFNATLSVAQAQTDSCSGMSAKVNITYVENEGAKVEIQVEGANNPVKYIFYKATGELLTEDFDSNTVSKIEKGKYFCTVSDARPCRITVEIVIE
jgi:hypothetical protein